MKSLLSNSGVTCTVDIPIISQVKFVDQTDATLCSEDVGSPQRTKINSYMASMRTTLQHTPSVDQSPLLDEEAHFNLFETQESRWAQITLKQQAQTTRNLRRGFDALLRELNKAMLIRQLNFLPASIIKICF